MVVRTGQMGKQILISLRDQVLNRLQELGAYLYYSAASGSQYIKFSDARMGSLRIGDHDGKTKYRYKWNLMVTGETKVENDRNVIRRYYAMQDMDTMIKDLKAYQQQLYDN